MTRDYATVERGFQLILRGLGVPESEHTQATAGRAAEAWFTELCGGLGREPPEVTTFASTSHEMVVVRAIPVRSVCAHHLLPFVGAATVAYIPGTNQILGLSKLSRLVDYYARRPQVQEELTEQIADAIAAHVMPPGSAGWDDPVGGVGVMLRARHLCMELRGVQHEGDMVTSALRGVFFQPAVRAEFLHFIPEAR